MDVAVITDEISHDIDEALEVMDRCSVRIAEIRSVWGKNATDMDPDELGRLRSKLDAAGVDVCALASPFFKCDLDEGTRAERGRLHEAKDLTLEDQMDLLERCFDAAEKLGTDSIRVFSFWRKEDPTPEIDQRIAEMFEEPVDRARERGMRLLLENEHACFLGTGVETARVLKLAGSDVLGAVWDPGNALCAGEVPFPDGYEAIKTWVRHVHVKDGVRHADGKVAFCKVGEGEVGYKAHIEQLKADGYNGILSLETHYSKNDRDKAGASEESLKALASLVRGV